MSCKFNDRDGKCEIFDGSIEMPGVDENGICICEDDENPGDTCEDYQER